MRNKTAVQRDWTTGEIFTERLHRACARIDLNTT